MLLIRDQFFVVNTDRKIFRQVAMRPPNLRIFQPISLTKTAIPIDSLVTTSWAGRKGAKPL
jgi:hypothetical protein